MGTALVFAVSGAVQASWMSRLPALKERLDLSLADLGVALFALGIGTLTAMSLTGKACRRFGSRRVVAVAAALSCVMLVCIGGAPARGLTVVLLCFGLASGAWDAAMNVQGSAVERNARNHQMTRFHGWWSVGSVAGAGLGILAARVHLPTVEHFAVAAGLGAAVCLVGLTAFVDERRLDPTNGAASAKGVLRRLVLIGAVILLAATVEGAAGDWLAVYLADIRVLSHAGAAAGYALFVTAMAAGRFAADYLHRRVGPVVTVRWGAVLAAIGVLLMLQRTPVVPLAFAGAWIWGLGICVVFPAALSASSRAAGSSHVVATMTTVGYGAGLVGPPFIGVLAHQVGLSVALLVLPVLAVAVALLAPVLGSNPRPAMPAPSR